MTPILRWIRSRVASSAVHMSSSPNITRPEIGGSSPIMCFMIVVLPRARAAEDAEHLAAATRRT